MPPCRARKDREKNDCTNELSAPGSTRIEVQGVNAMKAIIMAGGEGSRLRPLTCDRPKPLTPLLDRPVMEHIIKLLKRHEITDIGVTLQYLPEAIQDYFGDGSPWGVNLHYFIEETPLGTAGSVKNAEEFLDETFLVISGDALTDFNLSQAVEYHRKKQAIATLVLTPVENPLEYGVVITDESGAIRQFLEKPSWGEVFSDTVNTGIYVLEPEALRFFEKNRKYDFSQNLFPLLLRGGRPLYGCILKGYWCDIGNLQQYTQAHYDVLSGLVDLEFPGRQIQPGIWAEEGVELHPTARIVGPVFLGANTQVKTDAVVGPFTVLGRNTRIETGASLKRSILWNNVFVGKHSQIRGAVLCNGVQVRANASVFEGAVVGDESIIKDRCLVKPNVKIWPGKHVENGTTLRDSLIWGTRSTKTLFGLDGFPGTVNQELTPEFAAKLGAAFGSCLPQGSKITLSTDCWPAAGMLHASICAGLLSSGIEVLDLGTAITPVARYMVGSLQGKGGVHIKRVDVQGEKIRINLFNSQGGNISKGEERKIENLLAREDIRRVEGAKIRQVTSVPRAGEQYLSFLMSQIDGHALRHRRPSLVFAALPAGLSTLVPTMTDKLGCRVTYLNFALEQEANVTQRLAEAVRGSGADLGICLDGSGESLILVDDTGNVINDDTLLALISLVMLRTMPEGKVVVPVTASRAIEELAGRYKAQVVRTKTSLQSLMEYCLQGGLDGDSYGQFLMNFDALFALGKILSYLANEGLRLSEAVAEIPEFYLSKKAVECPWEAKGKVIRRLIEEHKHDQVELLDGIKVFYDEGWTLVLPDSEEPLCRVYGEGYSMEVAEALTDQVVERIAKIVTSV